MRMLEQTENYDGNFYKNDGREMTPPTPEELKACPFCGGKAEVHERGNDYTKKRSAVVSCTQCKTDGRRCAALTHPMSKCVEWATEIWNNRPLETALREEVERLTKERDELRSLRDDLVGNCNKIRQERNDAQAELSTLRAASEGREILDTRWMIQEPDGRLQSETVTRPKSLWDELWTWDSDTDKSENWEGYAKQKEYQGYRAVEVTIVRKSEVGG